MLLQYPEFIQRVPKTHWGKCERTATELFTGHRGKTELCLAPQAHVCFPKIIKAAQNVQSLIQLFCLGCVLRCSVMSGSLEPRGL